MRLRPEATRKSQLVQQLPSYKLTIFSRNQLVRQLSSYKLTIFSRSQLVRQLSSYKLTISLAESACTTISFLQADIHFG